MTSKQDDVIKVGLAIWVCICILFAIWFASKFLKGRNQLHANLNVVEDSLRKMQERIESEQLKKRMGFVESLDEITACLEEENSRDNNQERENIEATQCRVEDEDKKTL
ncbi:uncharacterized protein LOC132701213 isoform X2 [Cylas formicarius]|uniref:uncharacterized protein LOC132701213 isoform X2 n=1 Tax=Cylas formicarius TaxID=197179 RepID=UPI002958B003|nr:uncharacterized protein LOC132701213 isoform X2 [Cylas formicarius]